MCDYVPQGQVKTLVNSNGSELHLTKFFSFSKWKQYVQSDCSAGTISDIIIIIEVIQLSRLLTCLPV